MDKELVNLTMAVITINGLNRIAIGLCTEVGSYRPATLDEADWRAARELLESKYGTWAWNYGQNPACNVQRSRRFPGGEIDVRLDIQQGRIAGLRIFGDFMGRADVRELEARLCGLAYERDVVAGALSVVDPTDYFSDVSREDMLNILCP